MKQASPPARDEANRDWVLAALISHYPNLVDNMTANEG